jgi:hypothetical protein
MIDVTVTLGVLFAVLFGVSIVLYRVAIRGWNIPDPRDHSTQLSIAQCLWELVRNVLLGNLS